MHVSHFKPFQPQTIEAGFFHWLIVLVGWWGIASGSWAAVDLLWQGKYTLPVLHDILAGGIGAFGGALGLLLQIVPRRLKSFTGFSLAFIQALIVRAVLGSIAGWLAGLSMDLSKYNPAAYPILMACGYSGADSIARILGIRNATRRMKRSVKK